MNLQYTEALRAETSKLKMEVIPAKDLDAAFIDFVDKDDEMAFHSCLQNNFDSLWKKVAQDRGCKYFEDKKDAIANIGQLLEQHVKQRPLKSSDTQQFTLSGLSEGDKSGITGGLGSDVSFSDDEDANMISSSTSTKKGMKDASQSFIREDVLELLRSPKEEEEEEEEERHVGILPLH